jgi:uncharacterized membrane protein
METLAILLALGLLLLAAVAVVLGIAAYVRVRSLEGSVRDLERRLLVLQTHAKRTAEPARADEPATPPSVENARPQATSAAPVAPSAPRTVQPPPILAARADPLPTSTPPSNAPPPLAQRHASHVIAVLGLVGGFATPLALSSGTDRPFSLFGYVLLLDFGFLFVAQKRCWRCC